LFPLNTLDKRNHCANAEGNGGISYIVE